MLLTRTLSQVWSAGLDQLLPPRCGVCGAFGSLLCARCLEALPAAPAPRCGRCWGASAGGACPRCDANGCECTAIRAPLLYREGARALVRALKYGGQHALAAPMATLLTESWRGWGLSAEMVVPVPLHPRRQRVRGFNQSARLARPL